MEARLIDETKLREWTDALIGRFQVIAPQSAGSYGAISSSGEMVLGQGQPTGSLKELFLPQRQALLAYRLAAGAAEITEPAKPAGAAGVTRIIIGALPCDVAALPILDHVFSWDPADRLYLESRERTAIISVACREPCSTCFCVSLGGSPAGIEGADLLLTPLHCTYHVQIVSERGKELVQEHERFFEASDGRHNHQRAVAEDASREKVTKAVDILGLEDTLDFDNPVWETLAQSCVDCGICTFLCPTCHCFDIQDEGDPSQGERVRLWDACVFYSYTKTHSGQPRPVHYRRYRQRIMHKFRYYPVNFGRTLCVGCGRCIKHCPASIDLTQVLEAVKPPASGDPGPNQKERV